MGKGGYVNSVEEDLDVLLRLVHIILLSEEEGGEMAAC